MTASILIVDDEPAIQELIAVNLTRAGHTVRTAGDAESAQSMLALALPDMLLLDWNLPAMSGIEMMRWLRRDARTRNMATIMLTGRGDDCDKISALDAGADDYLTKPFSVRELLARIAAVLRRRAPQAGPEILDMGGMRMDPVLCRISVATGMIELSATEFRLLHLLMIQPDRVHSRDRLLHHVWGENTLLEARAVDACVRRIRARLQLHGREHWVQTVRGVGYRFVVDKL
jgi:two-component system phosphate regulon response regulator PhoB